MNHKELFPEEYGDGFSMIEIENDYGYFDDEGYWNENIQIEEVLAKLPGIPQAATWETLWQYRSVF